MTVQEVIDNDGAFVTIKMDSGDEVGKLVACNGHQLFERVRAHHLIKNEALCIIANTEETPIYFSLDRIELRIEEK